METIPAELLEQNTNDIDTSMPRLSAGIYELEIIEAKVEPSKDGAKQNLNVTFQTIKEASSSDGDKIGQGYRIYRTFTLSPTEKLTGKQIVDGIAQVAQSARKNVKVKQILDTPEVMKGWITVAKVTIQPERDGYPERNNIPMMGFVVKK